MTFKDELKTMVQTMLIRQAFQYLDNSKCSLCSDLGKIKEPKKYRLIICKNSKFEFYFIYHGS